MDNYRYGSFKSPIAVDVKKESGIMKSQCIKMIQRLIEYSEPEDVALLDYGQVKDLPDKLRLGYANLVLAITDIDTPRASDTYRSKTYPMDTKEKIWVRTQK
ncbi:Uncharacterized protein Fot_04478 [Forsythia ovata]|uniref:Uncharacterized protein n=1 Tax=Forsythia ovata TaxID=205694 RepID=A0ABD1XCP1_9LAMI